MITVHTGAVSGRTASSANPAQPRRLAIRNTPRMVPKRRPHRLPMMFPAALASMNGTT
jgi:hypothetical protein